MKKHILLEMSNIFRCSRIILSPKLNTTVCYRVKNGHWPDLKNPVSFKEKLLKLKLENYIYNPLVKQCADKYAVRMFVEERLACRPDFLACGEVY